MCPNKINREGNILRLPGRASSGYTITEVMIAAGISTVVLVGLLSFYLQFTRVGYTSEQKNLINKDMRQLTGRLSQAGRESNYFVLYESIAAEHRDTASDRRVPGQSGDFLVLVHTVQGTIEEENTTRRVNLLEKLDCYYRLNYDAADGTLASLGHYTKEFSPAVEVDYSAGSSAFEAILPTLEELSSGKILVELTKGLAEGRFFYNFRKKSAMINGQIFHGSEVLRTTETYNFTISPR